MYTESIGLDVKQPYLVYARTRNRSAVVLVTLMVVAAVWPAVVLFASSVGVPRLPNASWDQRRLVAELGAPSRFTVSYLPLGDRRRAQLTRTEVWYYPEHGQSISFFDGRILSVDPIDDQIAPDSDPPLVPWLVTPTTSVSEIASATASNPRQVPPSLIPAVSEHAEAYLSHDAAFVIERGRLVYLSTWQRSAP